MKVVLDTNIFVSAILFGGKPRRILESAFERKFDICVSEAMLRELEGVLRRLKFGLDPEIVRTVMIEIRDIAEWIVPVKRHFAVKNDPDDDMIIDCAVAAEADYIVTGDAHLLALKKFGRIILLNPEDFAGRLPG